MKKVLLVLLTLFIGVNVVNAGTAKIDFTVNNKVKTKLNSSKGSTFTVQLSYETKDFDLYAVLGKIDYDKKALELVKVTEKNNFTVTNSDMLLADRIDINGKDKNQIVELKFKVLKSGKSTISFKNITVASTTDELAVKDTSITINAGKVNYVLILGATVAVIVLVSGVAIVKTKKKKN